jgi:PAS domain S-box-containing protein
VTDYAIFMLDPDGRVMTWNAGAEKIKGYTRDEIIGSHFSRFYTQEALDKGWPDYELKMARAEGRFEDEGWRVKKDGSRFWANVVITALRDSDGEFKGFAKVTRDLTERRLREEALRQSEERFRLLVENVRDYAIFMLDPQGVIISWNSGAEVIKGYKAVEVIGRHFSLFYPPTDIARKKPDRELVQAAEEGHFEEEGWRLRKDGSMFWANVIITPIYSHDRILRGFAKVTRDMSERKRLSELETSSRHMSEFLAMLGHELRNPLAPIRNAVKILQMEEQLTGPDLKWCRDVIGRQVDHMARLVDDLLDVGRITTGKIRLQKTRIDFADAIARSIEAAKPLLDERGHRLAVELPQQPIWIDGDLTRLAQVFLNLLANAAKFTPPGGDIELKVSIENGQVLTQVRDSGIGIRHEQLESIFNLFVQDLEHAGVTEGGLGVGLTLTRSIAEMHGGSVQAFSAGPDQGSTFVVRIPLPEASAAN